MSEYPRCATCAYYKAGERHDAGECGVISIGERRLPVDWTFGCIFHTQQDQRVHVYEYPPEK